jgi:hypothetical protein
MAGVRVHRGYRSMYDAVIDLQRLHRISGITDFYPWCVDHV